MRVAAIPRSRTLPHFLAMSSVLHPRLQQLQRPLAITMWDFSWLERRWPGAGYEDWDRALDELQERGYDAVRIDAYPHLLANDPERPWELVSDSTWTVWDWGSPGRIAVRPKRPLEEFVSKCATRGIAVALSTWFRQDVDNVRLRIQSPEELAGVWLRAVELLRQAGVADHLLSVDLCNEFPGDKWAPFFTNGTDSAWNGTTDLAVAYQRAAVAAFRRAEPMLPCTVSFAGCDLAQRVDWSFLDFLEPHVWMAQANSGFYDQVGYWYQGRDTSGLEALAAKAEPLYRSDPEKWQGFLKRRIAVWAETSRRVRRPLMTTECWGPVDYKDWPGLDWGWVRELCEIGTREASATGCWFALATSNFCGPQFQGMWREVAWHRRMTEVIRNGPMPRY